MPKTVSANLASIFAGGNYSRRETLDLYLANGTVKRLSKGGVVRGGNVYQDYIRSVGDLVRSEKEIDRLRITCQNVNSELGLLAASDLRLLDYAVADYGLVYQSNVNLSLIEDKPQVFRTVVASAEITETTVTFDLITDFESLIPSVANRGLKEKCSWAYKNGRECTSNSSELTCPKTRIACTRRGKPYQFGGFEFFEEPTDSAPGTPGNSGGINPCFALDTEIRLVGKSVLFGDLPAGIPSLPIHHYSFNEETSQIEQDEIEEIFEHTAGGYFVLNFGKRVLKVTDNHRLFLGNGVWKAVKDFKIGDSVKFDLNGWVDLPLQSIERVFTPILVRNLRSKKNKNYFANDAGAHNAKQIESQEGF